jgi:hypothetical protein
MVAAAHHRASPKVSMVAPGLPRSASSIAREALNSTRAAEPQM